MSRTQDKFPICPMSNLTLHYWDSSSLTRFGTGPIMDGNKQFSSGCNFGGEDDEDDDNDVKEELFQ